MTLKKAYLLTFLAIAWLILGGLIFSLIHPASGSTLAEVLGWGVLIVFCMLFLTGTAIWAGAKGHHPFLGIVLGWLGPVGMLILVFLPDRSGVNA
jgi:hypothetical protein